MAGGGKRKSRPIEELPYRPCVGIALFNRDGLVFVGRRRSEDGPAQAATGYAWQMPQGGIDLGETPYDAAVRELHEETGVPSPKRRIGMPTTFPRPFPVARGEAATAGRSRNGSPFA
jgi:putative (di)nucleoside polyphosphate hydrolase